MPTRPDEDGRLRTLFHALSPPLLPKRCSGVFVGQDFSEITLSEAVETAQR